MMSAKYNELAKKIRRVYRGRKQKSVNDKIANVWQGLFGNYEKRADFNNQRYNKIMKEYDQEIRRLNNNKKDGNILNMFKTLNKGVKAEMDDDTIASDKIAEDDSATDDDEEQQSEEQHSAHYLINFIDFIAIFLDTKSCVALSICCTQTQIIMQEVLDDFLEILDFTIYDDTVRAGNANDDGIDDVKSYVKPKTLQQLKEYIKKEFDDCIHFFERRRGGKEHYYCKFCIEHPECTKALKCRGTAFTASGAEARLSTVWNHLIGPHDDVKRMVQIMKSKCYAKVKRAMKRNNSVGNVWKSIVFNVNRFRKRKFKNRGKSKKK
eukprot:796760_1